MITAPEGRIFGKPVQLSDEGDVVKGQIKHLVPGQTASTVAFADFKSYARFHRDHAHAGQIFLSGLWVRDFNEQVVGVSGQGLARDSQHLAHMAGVSSICSIDIDFKDRADKAACLMSTLKVSQRAWPQKRCARI